MIYLLSIIALGFFLGMRHATDPDHVIAVTTILSRQNDTRRAALLGLFWGIGHTFTILVVGVGIIFLGLVIPARVGLSLELSVGVMLVILGAANVRGFLRSARDISTASRNAPATMHSHFHSHGDYIHGHLHGHEPESHPHAPGQTPLARWDRNLGRIALYRYLRPLLVGIIHGLAGSAPVALLVLATIPNPRWAAAYLLVFGGGTIAGMMLITLSIASAFKFAGKGSVTFSRWIAAASGFISLAFGLFMAYQICFVNGLLAAPF